MRILLIEDMESDAELIRMELLDEWPALQLDWVNGRQPLMQALANPAPDLVLCDSRLPGSLHGSELHALVKRAWPDVPFAFCVGAVDDPALQPLLAQAEAVVDKNHLQALVPTIKRVMATPRPD
ncbi:MAG: response regulator [Xanthomonadales bacterium]|nr:response regulator [Xanthomonadales bacterium]